MGRSNKEDSRNALKRAYRDHGKKMLDNIRYRAELYNNMTDNPEVALLEKTLCLMDYDPSASEPTGIIRFFENHLWTHEPRGHILNMYGKEFMKTSALPFLLFDFQKRAVLEICNHIDIGRDILIDKSRDMGISWLIIGGVLLYYWWKPDSGNDFLAGSRKLEYVDKKGATDTLFEKFRYNLYRLHPSMFPAGFNENKHDNVAYINNPDSGSYMKGEANNANFATSGRYKAIFADEFSKWEETDGQAWTSMGDSSPCRIVVSTPWGMGRKFANLRFSEAIDVLTFHWSEHPIKGAGKWRGEHPFKKSKDVWLSAWYLDECERRKDDYLTNIGQELDIDYLSSGTPYFDNLLLQERYKETLNKYEVKEYDFEKIGNDEIQLFEQYAGRIKIYKEPVPGWQYRYLIVADVAQGLEKMDNSVMYVYDRVEKIDVAYFVGRVDTSALALILRHFGYWYNNCFLGLENNNHGHAVLDKLKYSYPFLMHEMDYTTIVDLENIRLGWNTNSATRPVMCADIRDAVNENVDGVIDPNFFKEAMTFIYNKNGKPEADKGKLDDRVIAQGIKWQLHKWLPGPRKTPEKDARFEGKKRFGGMVEGNDTEDIRTIWR
ncbi:MAG: hypothetical protein GF313_09410 [Caldithrix sp.]|nr:hypothetical protein [Caldithrix sp.]